jgi:hypothetical protein
MKALLIIVSFLIPLVGIILFFVYNGRGDAASKALAKNCLIAAIAAIVLICVCYLISAVCGVAMMGMPTG